MTILKSGITKHYDNYFILEEDSLRRFQAILEKAAKELPSPPEVVFRVEREDDRFYETLNIEDVLTDPNINGRRVGVVYIELRPREVKQEQLFDYPRNIVTLKFASDERFARSGNRNEVQLEISHDNRNWALLLADEIEPQIQRTFKAKGFPKLLIPILVAPLMVVILHIWRRKFNPDSTISTSRSVLVFAYTFVMLIMFDLMSKSIRFRWYYHFIGPESVFMWGEEANAYRTRQKIRQNILWGIIVAFLVSFTSGGLWLLLQSK